jgi:hypothetical protein
MHESIIDGRHIDARPGIVTHQDRLGHPLTWTSTPSLNAYASQYTQCRSPAATKSRVSAANRRGTGSFRSLRLAAFIDAPLFFDPRGARVGARRARVGHVHLHLPLCIGLGGRYAPPAAQVARCGMGIKESRRTPRPTGQRRHPSLPQQPVTAMQCAPAVRAAAGQRVPVARAVLLLPRWTQWVDPHAAQQLSHVASLSTVEPQGGQQQTGGQRAEYQHGAYPVGHYWMMARRP